MKSCKTKMHLTLAWVASLSLLVPQLSYASGLRPESKIQLAPSAVAPVIDVALGEQGILQGRVSDTAGAVRGAVEVDIRRGTESLVVVTTDGNGRFVVQGMEAGVYQIATDGGGGIVRVWAPGTAPPAAARGVDLRTDAGVIRGQGKHTDDHWHRVILLSSIVLTTGIIGGVIGYNIRKAS